MHALNRMRAVKRALLNCWREFCFLPSLHSMLACKLCQEILWLITNLKCGQINTSNGIVIGLLLIQSVIIHVSVQGNLLYCIKLAEYQMNICL